MKHITHLSKRDQKKFLSILESPPEPNKALKKAEDQESRAQKAEKKLKDDSSSEEEGSPKELSQKDVIYLAKADIHDDDMDEVINYASANEKTVKEAHAYLKPILDVKQEERDTAEVTITKGGKRGVAPNKGSDLLAKAEKSGEVPEDEAGMTKLAEARFAKKKAENSTT